MLLATILEKEQMSNIRAVYSGSRQVSAADLEKLQVFLPNGKLTPISKLATIVVDSGDAEIQRENLQSIGAVTARLENRDLGSVIKDIQQGN